MRVAKKTESADELADELASMVAQGAETLVLVEQDNGVDDVLNEWQVARAFAVLSVARSVQKLVDREAPYGRLYMIRAMRGEREIDRVLVDMTSARAELVPRASAYGGLAPAGGQDVPALAAFTHVLSVNERLMQQLTASSAASGAQYGQLLEMQKATLREKEEENARMRAELRTLREDDRADRTLAHEQAMAAKQLAHEHELANRRAETMLGTASLLVPSVLQYLGTDKGLPNPALQQAALVQLFASLRPEQINHILAVLDGPQGLALRSVFEATAKGTRAAHEAAKAANAPASPTGKPPAAAPTVATAPTGAASSDPREASFRALVESINEAQQAVLETTLTVRQFVTLETAAQQAAEGKPVDMASVAAMLATLTDAQRARLAEALSAAQLAMIATLSGAPPANTKPPASGNST